jgi:hypothetical protein
MTLVATTSTRRRPRPHVTIRRARKAQAEQAERLTDEILQALAAMAVAAAVAAAVTKAELTDAEIQVWRKDMEGPLATVQQHSEQNLGFMEEQSALGAREPLRLLTQRAAQAKANAAPCDCSHCHTELVNQKYLSRKIDSRFGHPVVFRRYGQCPDCGTWHFPADYALGLAKNAPASPCLQEVSALLVRKMPPQQAVLVAERFGLKLSRCTLHREAHRQGLKAEAARSASLAQLDTWEDLKPLARAGEGPPAQPFALVIEIDLWAVAHELYGQGTPAAIQWVAPLLKQIRKDQTPAVIKSLQELQPGLAEALQEKVQAQIEYFESQKNRMHYRQIIQARKAAEKDKATPEQRRKANEPLGSGAIESTCRQYQCRFKPTGQFWTMAGDQALMCLETFWRNDRWHELYPHVKLASPSLN